MRTKVKKASGFVKRYTRDDDAVDVGVIVSTDEFDSEVEQIVVKGTKVKVTFEWEVPSVWAHVEELLEKWKKDTFRSFYGCSMPVDTLIIGADLIAALRSEEHQSGSIFRYDDTVNSEKNVLVIKIGIQTLRLVQASRHGVLRLAYMGHNNEGDNP